MIFFLICALIVCCNAGSQISYSGGGDIELVQFERMIYNFVDQWAPKIKELHHNLTEVIEQNNYGNGPVKNSYLYVFPNIPKTVGMIYQTFETGLKMLISTLPKLVSVNGNSEAFGVTGYDLMLIENQLKNILLADKTAGDILTVQHNLLLSMIANPNIDASGDNIKVSAVDLEELMDLTIQFNVTNTVLGNSLIAAGDLLAGTQQLVNQQSPIASRVLVQFFNFLTSIGNSFVIAAYAGSDLNIGIRKSSTLHPNRQSYLVNLQSLYNAWDVAGEECFGMYDVIRLDMYSLLSDFWGSYANVAIP